MKKIIVPALALLFGTLTACGEPSEPTYFSDGGFMLPSSHANVLKSFGFFSEVEPGVAYGFDLDGVVSDGTSPDSCYESDYTDPDGRTGIDNQLAKIWTDLDPLVGDATRGLLQGSINEGRFLLMIELENLDDYMNDDDVTLHLFRGRLKPEIGTFGFIAPDQTIYFDDTFSSARVPGLKVVDGVLEAGPIAFQIPVDILEARFTMQVHSGKIRINIRDDGSFHGYIGGFVTIQDVLDELYATDAVQEAMLVTPFFENNADRNPVNGRCTDFSTTFHFEGTTAHVVRYPSINNIPKVGN
ncbi:MAG: hypothetical protein VX834_09095 [Myxococcota bacterium]|nr:hypothetical protein [Myxococcota bacterium]